MQRLPRWAWSSQISPLKAEQFLWSAAESEVRKFQSRRWICCNIAILRTGEAMWQGMWAAFRSWEQPWWIASKKTGTSMGSRNDPTTTTVVGMSLEEDLGSRWEHSQLTLWFQPEQRIHLASQVALVLKNLLANAGDVRDARCIPELGRSPGGRHGNPLQYSCLDPMDRGT